MERQIKTNDDCLKLGNAPRRLPKDAAFGEWEDPSRPGDCMWKFKLDEVPTQYNSNKDTWRDILRNCGFPNKKGVRFVDGAPDFSDFIWELTYTGYTDYYGEYTFKAGHPMTDRRSRNMAYGDREIAEHFDISQANAREARREQKLTWHETEDRSKMQLIPTIIHANIPHTGGVSSVKHGGFGSICGEYEKFEQFTYRKLRLHDMKKDIDVIYYTKTISQLDEEVLEKFKKNYEILRIKMNEIMDTYIKNYINEIEFSDAHIPAAKSLEIKEVIVYCSDNQENTVGVVIDFPLDDGHGIGFVVGGKDINEILEYGPDSVAL